MQSPYEVWIWIGLLVFSQIVIITYIIRTRRRLAGMSILERMSLEEKHRKRLEGNSWPARLRRGCLYVVIIGGSLNVVYDLRMLRNEPGEPVSAAELAEATRGYTQQYRPDKKSKIYCVFGNGRFQMAWSHKHLELFDVHTQKSVIGNVSKWRRVGDTVFFTDSRSSYAVIYLNSNTFQWFRAWHEIPAHLKAEFDILDQQKEQWSGSVTIDQ